MSATISVVVRSAKMQYSMSKPTFVQASNGASNVSFCKIAHLIPLASSRGGRTANLDRLAGLM